MLDPITLLAGAGLLASGYGAGRVGRARRVPKPLPEPKPICGCGHGYHDHDAGTNQCHAKVKKYRWDGVSEVLNGYEQCTCRKYVGPEPLPTYTAAELGL